MFFALLLLHHFKVFTSRLVNNPRVSACVDTAGWSRTLQPDEASERARAFHEPFRFLKAAAFKTAVGEVGCGQSLAVYHSALFVAHHKNTRFRSVCCCWCFKTSRTETPDSFFFVLFCFLLAAADVSFSPACMGSGAAGPASQRRKKKKVFIWCNGKETTTMCATFCSHERSSATKHFDWTLVSNPALQTVPFLSLKRLNTKALPQR